LRSVM